MKRFYVITNILLVALLVGSVESQNESITSLKQLFKSSDIRKIQKGTNEAIFSSNSYKNLLADNQDLTNLISAILVAKFNKKTYTVNLIPKYFQYMPAVAGILMHSAITEKRVDILKSLIYLGSSINTCNGDGLSPLYKAIKSGQDEMITLLIDNGADPNYSMSNISLLHRAAHDSDISVSKALIKLGALVDIEDSDGRTPLYYAIQKNRTNLRNSLIRAGANINFKSKLDRSLLYTAVLKNEFQVIKKLVQLGSKVDNPDRDGITPLFVSLMSDNPEITEYLLNKGSNINFVGTDGSTLLHKSVSKNIVNVTQKLLNMGANQSLVDAQGLTPLYRAIKDDNYDMINCLIKYTDVLNKKSAEREDYPINFALENSSLYTVKYLLERGAYKYARNKKGHFPLLQAILQNKTGIVEMLLSNNTYNLNVDTLNDHYKPLHLAVASKNIHIAHILISHGALINATAKQGKTAISMAVVINDVQMVRLLISNRADIGYKTEEGDTLLHLAVSNGALDVAILLIEHGLDVDYTNRRGITPIISAIANDNPHFIRLLVSKGAQVNSKMRNGENLLLLAIGNSSLPTVVTLIELGAGIDSNENPSPIEKAVQKNRADVLRYLVAKGVPLVRSKSLLHIAAEYNCGDVLQTLLNMGIQVDLEWENSTSLWIATKNNNAEAMRVLLKNGASINVTNLPSFPVRGEVSPTWTLLHETTFRNYLNATEVLLDNGINPNLPDFRSWTPLHYAAIMNNAELVDLLLKRGADPNAKTKNGLTVLGLAEYSHEKGKYKTISLLKSYIDNTK